MEQKWIAGRENLMEKHEQQKKFFNIAEKEKERWRKVLADCQRHGGPITDIASFEDLLEAIKTGTEKEAISIKKTFQELHFKKN